MPKIPDPISVVKKDLVNPDHYKDLGNYSAIHVIEKWNLGYAVGNAVKYIQRAGKKLYPGQDSTESELTDLKKARWYLQRRIHQLDPVNEPDPAVPDEVIEKRYTF